MTTEVTNGDEYVRTIEALTMLLDMINHKITELRQQDERVQHTLAAGHIRTACTYEKRLLNDLRNPPKGMFAATSRALREASAMPVSEAVTLLEKK
jgi:hypothetical protein